MFQSIASPLGVVFDSPQLYVSNHASTVAISSQTQTPTTVSSGDNSRGVMVDSQDNVFVSSDSGMVLKITPDGTKMTFATTWIRTLLARGC